MRKRIIILLAIFFLTACVREEATPPPVVEETDKEKPTTEQIVLKDFFMKDGTTANFKGEGNEYAQYTAKTQWLYDRYVNVYTDNGGTVVLRTFRIDEDRIVVLQEEPETYEIVTPTKDELDAMEPKYTYLQLPLESGATFNGWTVIDNQATLETPLQTFTNVIVMEQKNEDGSLNRMYFAVGYGEIKSEYISNQEYTVSSTIESVE